MTSSIRHLWTGLLHACEAFERAQRPWEQEGPLRWVKPLGRSWELHGATVPDATDAGESARSRVRW